MPCYTPQVEWPASSRHLVDEDVWIQTYINKNPQRLRRLAKPDPKAEFRESVMVAVKCIAGPVIIMAVGYAMMVVL